MACGHSISSTTPSSRREPPTAWSGGSSFFMRGEAGLASPRAPLPPAPRSGDQARCWGDGRNESGLRLGSKWGGWPPLALPSPQRHEVATRPGVGDGRNESGLRLDWIYVGRLASPRAPLPPAPRNGDLARC